MISNERIIDFPSAMPDHLDRVLKRPPLYGPSLSTRDRTAPISAQQALYERYANLIKRFDSVGRDGESPELVESPIVRFNREGEWAVRVIKGSALPDEVILDVIVVNKSFLKHIRHGIMPGSFLYAEHTSLGHEYHPSLRSVDAFNSMAEILEDVYGSYGYKQK